MVIDAEDDEILTFGEEYKKPVSDLQFFVFYKCTNEINCELREEDMNEGILNIYFLQFDYNGFYCDHQNPDSPIQQGEDSEAFTFSITDYMDIYMINWKVVKYEEETSLSGMFSKTYKYYGGEFTTLEKMSIPSKDLVYPFGNEYYKMVAGVSFLKSSLGYFDLYSRDKISILDPLANTCSLIMTLYRVLTFIFCGFYSNSFDNYKIIEKVIRNKSTLETEKREKIIELGDKVDSDNNNKEENLLEKSVKENIIILDTKENNNNKEDRTYDNKPNFKLPKFHFYDFFYNNIYNDKCCVSPSQEIISTCNDIISKYNSIERIVYNQIRLDNLFKDYKWNNPELNNIGNNDLISKIRNLSGN